MGIAEVLIAADDPRFMTDLTRELKSQGHNVTTCSLVTEALAHVSETQFDLVVVEARGGDRFELDVLRETKKSHPSTEVVIITELGTIDAAATAIRAGAFHYLKNPLSLEEISVVAQKALERRMLTQ